MKKYLVLIIIPIIFLFSCRKNNFITDNTAKLEFSVDTVTFDTIFSSIGSTTKKLLVYNRHDLPISISSINLAGGQNSKYRLNIDGMPIASVKDYELAANDSMYIFVEVTIDPGNDEMIEQDSIVFLNAVALLKVARIISIFTIRISSISFTTYSIMATTSLIILIQK